MFNNQSSSIPDYKKPITSGEQFASYLVFLIWPLLGVLVSFRYYKFRNSINVVWLFCIYVGLTFGFYEGTDSNRYRDDMIALHAKRHYSISEFWTYLIGDESNSIDILQPLINFLVSRFTDSQYILFGFYGLVFGYFYSRNIWFLIDKVKVKIKIEALAYLLLFAFLVPIWSINGFRYYTATHIFIYGIIRLYNNKKIGLFFVLLAPFFHYTYILGVLLVIIHKLFGNRIKLFFYGYVISIFLTFFNISYLNQFMERLPGKVEGRSKNYLNEEYAESYFDSINQGNWYIKYKDSLVKTLVGASFFWIFFKRRNVIMNNKFMLNLFCIGLIFMAFANITANIPSMLRFYYIGFMSVTMMLFLFFQTFQFHRRPDWYKFLSIFVVSVFCVVELRMGFANLTLTTVCGNLLTMELAENVNLLDFIRGN